MCHHVVHVPHESSWLFYMSGIEVILNVLVSLQIACCVCSLVHRLVLQPGLQGLEMVSIKDSQAAAKVLPPAMRDQSEHNLDQAMTT